ncbi:MAG: exosortase system-associated protein, TIGR04073 family [Lentisphaeria bacterium]
MKKQIFALLTVGTFMFSAVGTVRAEEAGEMDKALRQLGRGIGNVATGIFEVPANILEVQKEDGEVAAATYGLLRGVWRFGVREVVGVFEIASVPFVRLKPIVEPEFASEGGPVSVIYNKESRYPSYVNPEWKVNPLRLNYVKELPEPLPEFEAEKENENEK